ncbi:unnamed protein product [Sphagnum troendelagicum]
MLKEQQKFEERVAKELSGKQIKGDGEALGHVATCEPVVQPVTLPSLGHKDQPSASFSKASDEQPQNPTGLRTFFRSRKQFNGNQGSQFRVNHRSISDEGLEGHSIQ